MTCRLLIGILQVSKKQYKELSNLQVLQQVDAHKGLIWALEFSKGGDYLASGGQDEVLIPNSS